jgi:uncharacterized membrane protein YbhN (UPF0104 family)
MVSVQSGQPGSTGAGPGRRVRSALLQAALVAALLAAVVIAIVGLVPGSERRLAEADPAWVAAGVLSELVALAAYAALFHGAFSYGAYRVRWGRASEIAIGELGAFVVVPTGAGGPALRIWALLRGGMPFAVQMTRTVVHAVIFNVPYILAALVLGTLVALGLGPGHAPLAVALAPLAVVAASVALAVGAAMFARRRPVEPSDRWLRIGWQVIQGVPTGIRELPGRLRHPSLLLSATGYWAGDCGVLILSFHAVGGSPPVAVVVLAYMLGQLGNALPLPGGVGGTEPIMLGVLTASGVNLAIGAAAVVLYRFISLGLQALSGSIAVAALVRSVRGEGAGARVTAGEPR